jgi:hypothetical protein
MDPKNHARAIRYRQLALAEPDRFKAAILLSIADEANRNVLCTVDSTSGHLTRRRSFRAAAYRTPSRGQCALIADRPTGSQEIKWKRSVKFVSNRNPL